MVVDVSTSWLWNHRSHPARPDRPVYGLKYELDSKQGAVALGCRSLLWSITTFDFGERRWS